MDSIAISGLCDPANSWLMAHVMTQQYIESRNTRAKNKSGNLHSMTITIIWDILGIVQERYVLESFFETATGNC